ncbi:DUF6159 family protein [Thermodesulfobacteriota bacterium]
MGKFKTSWSLFRSSLSVIGKNKKLLLFPIIGFIFVVIIGLFFLSPVLLWDSGHSITELSHWETLGQHIHKMGESKKVSGGMVIEKLFGNYWYAWFVSFYLISMFSSTFLNVAFYNEIINGLNGKRVSLFRGIKAALSKIKLIMIWSLFAGAIGLIIRNLEERLGFVGRWIMALIGIAWSVASIFVIPVIIREEKSSNPVKLLKTSAVMLKKTWGETIIGYAGIRGFFLVILLITLPLLFAVCFIIGNTIPNTAGVILLLILLYLISMLILAYFSSVANHVYRGALYVYASEGVIPESFDEEMMEKAWKVKKANKK